MALAAYMDSCALTAEVGCFRVDKARVVDSEFVCQFICQCGEKCEGPSEEQLQQRNRHRLNRPKERSSAR